MNDFKIATWSCAMHGEQDVQCCGRAVLRTGLPRSKTLGSVPLVRRVDVRHELQVMHSRCLEVRADMLREWLSTEGTITELDQMIATLQHCKRQLGGRVRLWRTEGKDGFDMDADYYPLGEHADLDSALAAAHERLGELDRLQPDAGGQGGIQDRVYVVHPDGHRQRVFS